jgi:crotonobetainyl-CoA:carnitine CoA-transferase CaiB-like acyl-CoA transferase
MLNTFSAWFNGGVALGRTGNDHPSAAPYGVFAVDDGFILIATFNDREFVRLSKVLGNPEWATDVRFATMGARVANRELLRGLVTAALRGKGKAEWVEIMNAGTVSCGSINAMADLERDPQVQARGLIVTQQHPEYGTVRSAASPMRFSESPVIYRKPPPMTGEHTGSVLRQWLDYDDARINALHEQGAI